MGAGRDWYLDLGGTPEGWDRAQEHARKIAEEVNANRRGPADEDWEPDYEQQWEDMQSYGGLDTAGQERMYEKHLDRPWGDA